MPVRKLEPVVPVKVAQAKSGKTVDESSPTRVPEPAPRMAR